MTVHATRRDRHPAGSPILRRFGARGPAWLGARTHASLRHPLIGLPAFLALGGCTIRESDLLRWSIQSVSAGAAHTCGLNADGEVRCWGADDYGQASPPDGIFESVSAGGRLSCGLRESGAVECWGDIERDENTTTVLGDARVESVVAGDSHACALLSQRYSDLPDSDDLRLGSDAWCWGDLGEDLAAPEDFLFGSLSAGDGFSCGLEVGGGGVRCWGALVHESGGRHEDLSAAQDLACAVQTTPYAASVDCWGDVPPDFDGGRQQTDHYYDDSPITQIAAGSRHVCWMLEDGRVECSGDDSSGQASPPPGEFDSITAGAEHTCGIHRRRGLLCWGSDEEGQSIPTLVDFE